MVYLCVDKYHSLHRNNPPHLDNLKNKTVIAYTDGSCWWKDRIGGVGVYLKWGKFESHYTQGYANTSVGRMELLGLITAMQLVTDKNFRLEIYCDSQYAINCINKRWVWTWQQFKYAGKKNEDLLKELLIEYSKFPKGYVKLYHVKGHSGVEGNEIADELAGQGRKEDQFKIYDNHNYPDFKPVKVE